jgi:hypothetical protein
LLHHHLPSLPLTPDWESLHCLIFFEVSSSNLKPLFRPQMSGEELPFTSDEDSRDSDDLLQSYNNCPDDIKLKVRYRKLLSLNILLLSSSTVPSYCSCLLL